MAAKHGGKFQLSNLTIEDFTEYECLTESDSSIVTSTSTKLLQIGLPSPIAPTELTHPHFRNYSATVGSNVTLDCRLINVDGQKLSWIRMEDGHVMSSVRTTRGVTQWSLDETLFQLDIARAQASDSGYYECRVDTDAPTSFLFHVTVSQHQV